HVRRWKKTVDGAEQVSAGILSFAVYDLNFIAAPKIDAAVASFWIAEFNMQFEVGEFLVCGDIGSGGRAYHDTVFHFPLVIAHGMPSVQVLAVKKHDLFIPYRITVSLEGRRTGAGHGENFPVRIDDGAQQAVILEICFKYQVIGCGVPLWRDGKTYNIIRKDDAGNGSRASALSYILSYECTGSRMPHFEPC